MKPAYSVLAALLLTSFSPTGKANSAIKAEDFAVGGALFQQPWVVAPASTPARDGLGPLFKANSCLACHVDHGRGHPPLTAQEPFMSAIVKLAIPASSAAQQTYTKTLGVTPDPVYGDHLQPFALQGLQGEGTPRLTYREIHGQFADGTAYTLLQPQLHIEELNYGALAEGIQFSVRVAPPLFGIGLLESVTDAEILANADPEDKDNDGISGKPNQVWDIDKQQTVLGRLSWKANQPSICQQTADALRNDIGITTSLFPEQPCSPAQPACLQRPHGGTPEMPDTALDKLVYHVTHLPAPAARNHTDAPVLQGQKLFQDSGCAQCHIPSFPSLAAQGLQPYTDLLLHDMGEGLADHRPEFAASGSEWRTAPLWGIGLSEQINGHTRLLHDGRARNVLEAILWHSGEAEAAKQAVLKLSQAEREALVAFIHSL